MEYENIEPLTFSEILMQENQVICDGSLSSVPKEDWYGEGVYEARTFSEVDIDLGRSQVEYMTSFLELLKNPEALTVTGVS